MKFIKKFENHQGYEAYIAEDYPKPNVSYCVQENEVHYNPILPPPPYSGFCKLTLNSGNVVEIEGSGELTRAMTSSYSETCVSAEIGTLCTSIGNDAFKFYLSLTSITIPDSVTSIGTDAFSGCIGLTSITIPNSVTRIGNYAFDICSGLTSVTIGSGITSIGDRAFYGCGALTSVTVNSSNTVYDSRNNCNAIIETSTNTLIRGCNTTVIPSSVTSIDNYAFTHCRTLTSMTIPDSVTSIGAQAFENCSRLSSVTIGSGVTSIGDNAFVGCTSLTNITIPNSVTSIGKYTFESCYALTSVTVEATTPPTLGSSAFIDTNNCPIYVPSGSVEAYKQATNWSTYYSRIQAIPTT